MAANPNIELHEGDTLIIADVQNDFLSGGSLAVAHGDEVIPVLNAAIERFRKRGLPIIATRDWHPVNHCSFRGQGGPWPPHCVANSAGAAIADNLHLPPDATVISKATSPDREAYSGFEGTELEPVLRAYRTQRVFIGGLTTDYCVLNTVMDALARRFRVFVLDDAIRAVNIHPGDGDRAKTQMKQKGAQLIGMEQLA